MQNVQVFDVLRLHCYLGLVVVVYGGGGVVPSGFVMWLIIKNQVQLKISLLRGYPPPL